MNLIDAVVTKVLSKPKYEKVDDVSWWSVLVQSIDMGGPQEEELIFNSEEEALEVKEGYTFLH